MKKLLKKKNTHFVKNLMYRLNTKNTTDTMAERYTRSLSLILNVITFFDLSCITSLIVFDFDIIIIPIKR